MIPGWLDEEVAERSPHDAFLPQAYRAAYEQGPQDYDANVFTGVQQANAVSVGAFVADLETGISPTTGFFGLSAGLLRSGVHGTLLIDSLIIEPRISLTSERCPNTTVATEENCPPDTATAPEISARQAYVEEAGVVVAVIEDD
jgi:hypothetical protein